MKTRYLLLFLLLLLFSCSNDYLDIKPNKAIVTPNTLSDLESILNYTTIMNTGIGMGILSVDDFFLTDAGWQGLIDPTEQNIYTWERDIYRGVKSYPEWSTPYQQVFYANTVLDILPAIPSTPATESQWREIKGRALFHRAFAHYQLAQVFCQPYYKGGENNLGIPVRTSADLAVPVRRSTVAETYHQIISDLMEAKEDLPGSAINVFSPAKAAANALLSKTYLLMGDYVKGEEYASTALQQQGNLMDFNSLNPAASRPIPLYNEEILFQSVSSLFQFPFSTQTYVDTLLYQKYEDNDLRKTIFFRNRSANRFTFKGTYTGTITLFTGLATDELYLNRAECRARLGNVKDALEDLNTLLASRYKTGTFTPITILDADVLLETIVMERQKELLFRPERWSDTRRLNLEGRFARSMARKLKGETFTLPPDDVRYVYAIPADDISYSHIEQNPR